MKTLTRSGNHTPLRRDGRFAALLAVCAVVLAACGGGDGTATPTEPEPMDTATPTEPEPMDTATVRVGYLNTLAVDGIMWTGIENGYFENQGIDLVTTRFDSGIALSQAVVGGSIDLAVMGAVISNFPAQGQGTAVIANNIEADTAQIWAQADSGIETVDDLKGKTIATVQGTTAHILLHYAATDAGLSTTDYQIANSDMATAVNAFLSGSVPALVTWAPNDVAIRARMPDAKLIATAGDYFPDAAILGGWVASNDFYANHQDVIERVALAWLDANHELMTNTEASLERVWEAAYSENVDDAEALIGMFEQIRSYTNDEWAELYADGSVSNWLGQVQRTFVDIGGLDSVVDPSEFFDPSIFTAAYGKWSQR